MAVERNRVDVEVWSEFCNRGVAALHTDCARRACALVTLIAGRRVLAIARNSPHLSGPVVRGLSRRLHARVVGLHAFKVRDGMLDGAQAVAAAAVPQTALDRQTLMASRKRYAAPALRGVKARVCRLPAATAELRLACGGGPDPSGEFSLDAGVDVSGSPPAEPEVARATSKVAIGRLLRLMLA